MEINENQCNHITSVHGWHTWPCSPLSLSLTLTLTLALALSPCFSCETHQVTRVTDATTTTTAAAAAAYRSIEKEEVF